MYDGYTTVDDPLEYLNAPAMMMTGSTSPPPHVPGSSGLPMILQAAVDYSQEYRTLSADELQTYYAEQSNISNSLNELRNRLEVEYKMRQAANSIGKLHNDDKASVHSMKTTKRLSKMLTPNKDSKNEKRLSKQAADEVAMSNEKIQNIQNRRTELERRKSQVDLMILEHHCSVMAKSIIGKPMPNHRRNASDSSNISSNTQASHRSWIVAPRHQRQISATSNGDSASLATVTEHPNVARHVVSDPPTKSLPDHVQEELDQLSAKIAQAMPEQSPALQGQVPYIASTFDRLYRELTEARNNLESSQIQVEHLEARISHLQMKATSDPVSRGIKNGSSSPTDDISLTLLKRQFEEEQAKATKWRNQAETQREQLSNTTKSLEDVTRLSVQLESERAQLDELLPNLYEKIAGLQQQHVTQLNQRLASTTNTSLLCREFQHIVADLVSKHALEIRELYPTFSRTRPSINVTDASNLQNTNTGNTSQESKPETLGAHDSSDDLKPPRLAANDQPNFDTSYDDSIQNTDESFTRPEYSRQDTDASQLSKTSSYYPEHSSANPSMASVARGASQVSLSPRPHQEDDDGLL